MALFEKTGMCADTAARTSCETLAKETAGRLHSLATVA
jgi:hypothetical protein